MELRVKRRVFDDFQELAYAAKLQVPFLNEHSQREKDKQKQNKEFEFRYSTSEMLIRQSGKQLNRGALSHRSAINLTGRVSFSYFKSFEEASFNLHILGSHFPFFLLPPPISKEIDFTLHEMLQYFQFKWNSQINEI